MTTEQLQNLLSTPAALFVVMLLASLGSGLKQVTDARRNGSTIGIGGYLVNFWPETIGMLAGNGLAFLALVMSGQLNFASAVGIGYGINSAADLLRSGGRSAALSEKPKTEGEK